MSRPLPDQALENYLDDLRRRDVATKHLTLARHFLRHLISTMRDLPQDATGYRKAAELTLRNFPEDPNFVELIRDFYPHWSGETAPPIASHSHVRANPSESGALQEALTKMNNDPWSHTTLAQLERQAHQLKSLARYAEELKKAGLDDANINARLKLIKLLLFTIRDVAQNTDSYRNGVDQVLTLFPHQERWHVYVSLAREFFYFLANDVEAGAKLQKQIATNEMIALMAK